MKTTKIFSLFLLIALISASQTTTPNYLVSSSLDGKIQIWDNFDRSVRTLAVGGGFRVAPIVTFHQTRKNIIAFAPSEISYPIIQMYDILNNKYCSCIHIRQAIHSLAFHPTKENLIAAALGDGTIKIFNIKKRAYVKTLRGHLEPVTSIAFPLNPIDENIIASASQDYTIKLWNMETEECLMTLREHEGKVTSVAFNPFNENSIVSSSADGSTKVWSIRDQECVKTLQEGYSPITSVVFHPTEKNIIATASHDKKVRIWNISTGALIKTLGGHRGKVYAVAFHPEYEHIIVSSSFAIADPKIKVWDWKKKKSWIKDLGGLGKTVGTLVFSPQYKDDTFEIQMEDEIERIGFLIEGLMAPKKSYPHLERIMVDTGDTASIDIVRFAALESLFCKLV